MLDLDSIFKGKKITQMGLGLLGRGIGDAQFLARHGADLIVTDKKTSEDLKDSVAQLSEFSNITLHLGVHEYEDFKNRDLILKGAGVPLDSPHIQTTRDVGVPVDMSASLFARIAGIPMVGVTGTRGKSTVTHLIHAILVHAGKKTILGGNVRGVSNLALLDTVTPEYVGVFELDSWQCQGFAEEYSLDAVGVQQGPLSPQFAVFTTLMPDHMNYYNGSMEQYCDDKAQIFLHQNPGDTLVIGTQALPFLELYRTRMKGTVIIADERELPNEWNFNLPGIHNRYNAGCAIAVTRAMGIEDTVIREAVEQYRALPGRLESVGLVRGIPIYNDNNATTPDATAAALKALDTDAKKNIILIAGGSDKGLALTTLHEAVDTHARRTILIPGSGTKRFVSERSGTDFTMSDTLAEAFSTALEYAEQGDTILFSPGFASFGQYANEYERNDEFMRIVASYA
jgi:UDP-N-acetylmuramoylalanine--D-glutamate ligase